MLVEFLKTFIIGLVEGITEWLPISSTGHMILVDKLLQLKVSPDFLSLFLVVIQLGAILAVCIMYFDKLNPFSRKKTPEQRSKTWHLWAMVCIGSIPAALVGIALDDWVSEHLYNKFVVALALIVYGIAFIVIEAIIKRKDLDRRVSAGKHASPELAAQTNSFLSQDIKQAEEINWITALKIGLFQVLAIIPGTSRSGATILGGMIAGCSRAAASEFTFFLAIPIMLGWGIIKLVKFLLKGMTLGYFELTVLIIGCGTAFVTSIVAISFLMTYIKRHNFSIFGWYRIVLGLVVLGSFFGGFSF